MSAPFRVILLDTKTRNPNHYICLSIARALERNPNVESVSLCNYGNAIETAYGERANLFIAFDGETLNRAIIARLGLICGRSLLWVTEDPYEAPENIRNSEHFDLVFTNDEESVPNYGTKGRYLPFAADEALQRFEILGFDDPRLQYDVAFIGSAWPNRVRLLRSLLREFPDLHWKIGLATNEHLPPISLPIPPSAYTFRTSPVEFARIANASKVVLGLHRSFTTSSGAAASTGSPPPRLFEVALAGTAQICDSSISSLGDFYVPDREVIVYTTFAELCAQIRHLVSSPDARSCLALAAQERTAADHLYDNRVATLIDAARTCPTREHAPTTTRKKKAVILQVVHNTIAGANFGGVEVYLSAANRGISRDFDVFTLSYDQTGDGNAYVLFDGNQQIVRRTVFDGEYQLHSISNESKEKWFSNLLIDLAVDVVHVQHLIGFPLSLPIIAKALGARVALTLHDYWGICDSFNLLDERGRFCRIDERDPAVCDPCTQLRHGRALEGFQRSRRQFFGEVLRAADVVVANTEGSARRYRHFFHEALDDRLRILPVPLLDDVQELGSRVRAARATSSRLRVALLGNVSKAKGLETALATFQVLAPAPIDFVVLGRTPDEEAEALAELGSVRLKGSYRVAELPGLLADIDVTLHLSVWPETYCMSLSEAWACGCVPIASNIGAMSERIVDGINGYLVAPDDPHDLIRVLQRLAMNRDELYSVQANIDARLWLSEDGHLDRLRDLYNELLAGTVRWPRNDGAARPLAGALSLFDCGRAVTSHLLELSGSHRDATTYVERSAAKDSNLHAPVMDFAVPRRFTQPLRSDPHVVVTIDELKVATRLGHTFDVGDVVSMRGWAARSDSKTALDARRVCLLGVNHDARYVVPVRREERADVAAAWRAAGVTSAGFRQTFSLEVEAGQYQVVVADDSFVTSAAEPFVIDVLSKVRTLSKTPCTLDVPMRGSLDKGAELGASGSSGASDFVIVEGWVEALVPEPAGFEIAIQSELDGSIVLIHATRYERPDVVDALGDPALHHSGFRAYLSSAALSPGPQVIMPAWVVGGECRLGSPFAVAAR